MSEATLTSVEVSRFPEFGPWVDLAYSLDRSGDPQEGGRVQFSWDDAGFYVRAEFVDSFIIVQNPADEQLHYLSGDVFELFMKPLHKAYYWEMYATPTGHKSTLFFPRDRIGMDLADFLHGHDFQSLEVSVEETDKGWNAQLFVPVSQLTALGAGWGNGTQWTVLCGRYNYNSADLAEPELSMAPRLTSTNFHLTDEYADLTFS